MEKIELFNDAEKITTAKIAMMCSDVIQRDFLSLKKNED